MKAAKILIGISSFLLFMQGASAADLSFSCQVPGFLNFDLETTQTGTSVLRVNQYSYGLRYGPATTLAKSLGILPLSGSRVQSLVFNQNGGAAVATFEFTGGSAIQINLGKIDISVQDGTYKNNGVTYPSKILKVISSTQALLNIPAQENLCGIGTPLERIASFGMPNAFLDMRSRVVSTCTFYDNNCPSGTHLGPRHCQVEPSGLRRVTCECCDD